MPISCSPSPDAPCLYRLQGLERLELGPPVLASAGASPLPPGGPVVLSAGEWLGSGTFRNSLYLAPWRALSRVADLWLHLELQGEAVLRLMCAGPGQAPRVLRECLLGAADRGVQAVPLGLLADLPADGRLFWHLEARTELHLHEAQWATSTPPVVLPRLAVLQRTHGRSRDVQQQLRRFDQARTQSPAHAACLQRCAFWVLDASADAAAQWADEPLPGLDLRVLQGPNLGGGGNASLLLEAFLAREDALAPELQADEVLLLDDDGVLSAETLARHLALCAWRREDHVMSLPVLMRSQPLRVWEDGGFWGREALSASPERPRRTLAPTLVRHGLLLEGFAHLDAFAPLNRVEYATFIFFGLPVSLLRRLGLPAAFFLRGDDIEWSLRAGALGVPVYTNPNLAAWHEPGHGYAQEYMAILHGAVINLVYSANGADEFLGFFEARLREHAALGDLAGLALYRQVVEDLLDPDLPLLEGGFERHYQARLPAVGAPMPVLPAPELERLRARAREGQLRLLPWLYPGPVTAGDERPTVLWQEEAGRARALPEVSASERLQALQSAIEALLRLGAGLEACRVRWQDRLRASGERGFWQARHAQHADAWRPLRQADWVAPPPLREVAWRRLPAAPVAAAPAPVPAPPRPALWRRWWPSRRTAAADTPSRLPPDFDPPTYLALNADVARSGVDPARHYLRYGRLEGRRYRPA